MPVEIAVAMIFSLYKKEHTLIVTSVCLFVCLFVFFIRDAG